MSFLYPTKHKIAHADAKIRTPYFVLLGVYQPFQA